MNAIVEHLESMEDNVKAQDILGEKALANWMEIESDWLRRALDPAQRDELEDPYHVAEMDRRLNTTPYVAHTQVMIS